MDHHQLAVRLGQGGQNGYCLVVAVSRCQGFGAADLGGIEGRMVLGNQTIGLDRQIGLPLLDQKPGRQQDAVQMVGPQKGRRARIDKGIGIRCLAVQGGGDGEIDFGDAIGRIAHDIEGQRLAGAQLGPQRIDHRILFGAKFLVQQGKGIFIAFQLAQDLCMRDHATAHHAQPAGHQRIRTFEIANGCQRQGLVIMAKGLKAARGGNLVEPLQRFGHAARANLRPGEAEHVHGGIDGATCRLIGQKFVERPAFRLICRQGYVCSRTIASKGHDPLCNGLGAFEISQGHPAHQRTVQQRRIVRISQKRAREPGRRIAVIACDHGRAGRKIGPCVFFGSPGRQGKQQRGKNCGKKRAGQGQGRPPYGLPVKLALRSAHVHAGRPPSGA